LLGSAGFGEMGAGVGPDPPLLMHREGEGSEFMGLDPWVEGSGRAVSLAARPVGTVPPADGAGFPVSCARTATGVMMTPARKPGRPECPTDFRTGPLSLPPILARTHPSGMGLGQRPWPAIERIWPDSPRSALIG